MGGFNFIRVSGFHLLSRFHPCDSKDFTIAKLQIVLKECCETEYWLELLYETGYIPDEQYKPLQNSCGSIRRMLIASINTTKTNQ